MHFYVFYMRLFPYRLKMILTYYITFMILVPSISVHLIIFQTTRSPPYQPLRSPPITMPVFSRRPICHTAALVEHVSETTGSGRAQTRAVWQRGRRENPPQPSYQFFLFYIQSAPNTAPQAVNTSHSDKKHPARSPVVPPKYFIAFR